MKHKINLKTSIVKITSYGFVIAMLLLLYIPVDSFTIWQDENRDLHYRTKAQIEQVTKIYNEMIAAGYSNEQTSDQIYEEIHGMNGWYGTGGKDGLLLDGTPAPNAPGNKSSESAASKCDHSYTSEVTKEATCTEAGKTTYTCEKCGKKYTEKIPKLEHTFTVTEEVKGTCIEKGYRVETCTECGFTQTIEGIYGDHDLWVNGDQLEPTCEEGGFMTEQCKLCFEMFRTELPALGHEYETTPTVDHEPYCIMSGDQSYHCIRCDECSNVETIPALGHEEVVEEKKAGIFTNGYLKITCARCGQALKNETYYSFVNANKLWVISGTIIVLALTSMAIVVVVDRKKKKSKK